MLTSLPPTAPKALSLEVRKVGTAVRELLWKIRQREGTQPGNLAPTLARENRTKVAYLLFVWGPQTL